MQNQSMGGYGHGYGPDDDDLSQPWRITRSYLKLGERKVSAKFFNCARLYYIEFDFDIYERAEGCWNEATQKKIYEDAETHLVRSKMHSKMEPEFSLKTSFIGALIDFTILDLIFLAFRTKQLTSIRR